MADLVASTPLRDAITTAVDGWYFWVTLHDGTGGWGFDDVYAAGVNGEIATGNGYTRGDEAVNLADQTGGVLDAADATWTTGAGETLGPVTYAALWFSTSNSITGAELISVKDMTGDTQTASNGGTMTASVANPVTIGTPS